MDATYDVVIVGGGAAGLTAALYTSRTKLNTVIIEREAIGGELMNRDQIENYPGYPDGIMGPELGSNMMTQAMNHGAEIKVSEVEGIEVDGVYKVVKTAEGHYRAKAVILASGAHPKKLGIPGEEEFIDNGVFYCATCDGPRFAGKTVAVAGSGDSGLTEALFLTRFVSKVVVFELLPYATANKSLQERAFTNPKITARCGYKIEAIRGDDAVKELDLLEVQTEQKSTLEADGLLVHIGLEPNTDYLKSSLMLSEKGQVPVNEIMETTIAGIFAAGDIRHNSPMQIATAVGDGATAALSFGKYLETRWNQA
ncbi:MAG: FAD-dependent oxidoreductase [Dehalococcoidales bacterium]|jgi:thioredoxin reductase (NADPH)|nr:FAD-dependent oxidoreductase [Dehalococcoidales bacterium]